MITQRKVERCCQVMNALIKSIRYIRIAGLSPVAQDKKHKNLRFTYIIMTFCCVLHTITCFRFIYFLTTSFYTEKAFCLKQKADEIKSSQFPMGFQSTRTCVRDHRDVLEICRRL